LTASVYSDKKVAVLPIKQKKAPQLKRDLTLFDTSLLVIGSILGSGIFLTTGIIAAYLSSPLLILCVWLVGGVATLCGALTFGELGAMYPSAGGQYIYLREAYGPLSGFLFGWGFFWIIECGGIAALAVGFAEYLGYFIPSLSTHQYLLQIKLFGFDYSLSFGQFTAVAAILLLSGVNYFGIKQGAITQNIFTVIKVAAVFLLIVLGLGLGKKTGYIFYNQQYTGGFIEIFPLFGLALIAVMWTYDGWYSASITAGEIRNPERNIPRGLIIGTASITVIYFLMNCVYLLALPVENIKGVVRIGEKASTQLFGATASSFISALIMISIFGCLSATIIYGPRVYYAMSKDGAFFRSMAHVHPRYKVPSKSIFWQAVWSSLLCFSGTYEALFEYVIFALVIFFAATGLAVFILRYKKPELPRPYKTWGYPVIPVIFILINLGIFFNTIIAQPLKSLLGLVILLLGVPAFLYWKRKNKN